MKNNEFEQLSECKAKERRRNWPEIVEQQCWEIRTSKNDHVLGKWDSQRDLVPKNDRKINSPFEGHKLVPFHLHRTPDDIPLRQRRPCLRQHIMLLHHHLWQLHGLSSPPLETQQQQQCQVKNESHNDYDNGTSGEGWFRFVSVSVSWQGFWEDVSLIWRSSKRAMARGCCSLSSSSLRARMEGLEQRTSSCSLIKGLPWVTTSSMMRMQFSFFPGW